MGVCLLRLGDKQGAVRSISEALRLDPENASARHNFVLAMGAKNPFYGLFWRWSLLLTRLPSWGQIGVILGLWAAMRGLDALADANPALRPYATVVLGFYVLFCIYTWVAPALFKTWLKRQNAI